MGKTETIKELISELLKLLLIEGSISVEQKEDSVAVNIETQQSGGLIGYHGEGLVALQLILNILVNKKLGSWQKVVVNVGDYRQKREEYLKNLAQASAEKVKNTHEPSVLTGLSSFERRIVHLVLAEDQTVESFSEGEGNNRRLVIRLKS